MGGPRSFTAGLGIAVDDSFNIYTTGYFSRTVDFDPNTGISNLSVVGNSDFFVQKLSQMNNNVAIDKPLPSPIKLYPNPSSGLFFIALPTGVHEAHIQISDAMGRLVHQSKLSQSKNQLDISQLTAGIYQIEMSLRPGKKLYGKLLNIRHKNH